MNRVLTLHFHFSPVDAITSRATRDSAADAIEVPERKRPRQSWRSTSWRGGEVDCR